MSFVLSMRVGTMWCTIVLKYCTRVRPLSTMHRRGRCTLQRNLLFYSGQTLYNVRDRLLARHVWLNKVRSVQYDTIQCNKVLHTCAPLLTDLSQYRLRNPPQTPTMRGSKQPHIILFRETPGHKRHAQAGAKRRVVIFDIKRVSNDRGIPDAISTETLFFFCCCFEDNIKNYLDRYLGWCSVNASGAWLDLSDYANWDLVSLVTGAAKAWHQCQRNRFLKDLRSDLNSFFSGNLACLNSGGCRSGRNSKNVVGAGRLVWV